MAKDISEKKIKKEKKDKQEKRSESEGVTKAKKEKKIKSDVAMIDALDAELDKNPDTSLVKIVNGDEPRGALVPFAFPLSDDPKELKKILKTIKKCMLRHWTLMWVSIEANKFYSREDQDPASRRQRSCQGPAQVKFFTPCVIRPL